MVTTGRRKSRRPSHQDNDGRSKLDADTENPPPGESCNNAPKTPPPASLYGGSPAPPAPHEQLRPTIVGFGDAFV